MGIKPFSVVLIVFYLLLKVVPMGYAANNVKKKVQIKSSQSLTKPIKMKWDMQRLAKDKLPNGWVPLSGEWEVVAEPEHPSNKVLRQKTLRRKKQVIMSKARFSNFDLSVSMRADSFERKTKNWQMGIIFRKADDHHYYKLRITAANIALKRYSAVNKEIIPGSRGSSKVAGATGRVAEKGEQVLMILPIGSVTDKWHTLGIQCYGDRISIKLNGREVRAVNDTGIGSGKIGLYTYKTQAFVDDLKLVYLPVPKKLNGIRPVKNHYYAKKDGEMLIYFNLEKAGIIELTVNDPKNKMFSLISKGHHARGINTVLWNGRGNTGEIPLPGTYTINVKQGNKHMKSKIVVH